jgi:hypothetical protein
MRHGRRILTLGPARGTNTEVTENDKNFVVKVSSPNGIATLQLVANGSQIVDETKCAKAEAWECLKALKLTDATFSSSPGSLRSLGIAAHLSGVLGPVNP